MHGIAIFAAYSQWPLARIVAGSIGVGMILLAFALFIVGLYTQPKDYRLRFGKRDFRP